MVFFTFPPIEKNRSPESKIPAKKKNMFLTIQKITKRKKKNTFIYFFKQKIFVKKRIRELYYIQKNKNACEFFYLIFRKRYGSMFYNYAPL